MSGERILAGVGDTTPQQRYEAVDHPAHYNQHPAGIECIDVIEVMPFNIGTAIKYLWRAGLKPGSSADQDLAKAAWYIGRERQRLAVQGEGAYSSSPAAGKPE